jgi:hypothetical protein
VEVDDDTLIYRLVPAWNCQAVNGQWEFQSGAFDNASPITDGEPKDDMSVILGDTLAALSRVPEALPIEADACSDDREEWGVAVLQARFLRNEESQDIRRTPMEDEPAHGDVRGTKNLKRRRRIKKQANWVIRPTRPAI